VYVSHSVCVSVCVHTHTHTHTYIHTHTHTHTHDAASGIFGVMFCRKALASLSLYILGELIAFSGRACAPRPVGPPVLF